MQGTNNSHQQQRLTVSITDEETRKRIVDRVLADRARRPEILAQMKERQQKGLTAARRSAQLLKEQFGASRVVLFGSLLNYKKMSWISDIDLAVWGLPEKDYFQAVSRLLDIDPEFSIDLVEIQNAKPHILKVIEAEGVEL